MIKFTTFFMVSALILSSQPKTYAAHPKKLKNVKLTLNQLYDAVNGFTISSEESEEINNQGGAATYGEITYESFETVLKDLQLTKKDVFYDLGCGVGKTCVQAVLSTPLRTAVGIELSPSRVASAEKVKSKIQCDRILGKRKQLEFRKENIAATDFSDATVIFMCSTCFSDALMQSITNKCAQCKPGLRVITLRQLPAHPFFKKIKEYTLPMTWSENSPVHVYRLEK